ncbi:30S ribosomal protein S6e [Metallosphaera hakonensis]|uniref:Small ribosomal subunit protein eS6 n=1 Tax=Metallosphaera hakonensis JCM 8857 = DSM 7519 TaxID=1293036 RepID=A0A2U9IU66_9CREN|nr:30S ribosomal protein S6e [Metallosphaera hakonensis]AWR99525.1 30S ribosomal protein S6e [Metallosphaera hakonensis JCM 8857 = DSM 7519]
MADFKIVISDPASKKVTMMRIKVKLTDTVQSEEGEKEGRTLPVCLINPKTKEKLGADQFITVEIKKQEGDKKVKIKVHFLVKDSAEVPEGEILASKTLAEKFGSEEFEAIAYRTKSFQISVDQNQLNLIGSKIGDNFTVSIGGTVLKLIINGGSDNTGFPMRPDVQGAAKRRILLAGPPGFIPSENGEKRRKVVRGNVVSPESVQINCLIVR